MVVDKGSWCMDITFQRNRKIGASGGIVDAFLQIPFQI